MVTAQSLAVQIRVILATDLITLSVNYRGGGRATHERHEQLGGLESQKIGALALGEKYAGSDESL